MGFRYVSVVRLIKYFFKLTLNDPNQRLVVYRIKHLDMSRVQKHCDVFWRDVIVADLQQLASDFKYTALQFLD